MLQQLVPYLCSYYTALYTIHTATVIATPWVCAAQLCNERTLARSRSTHHLMLDLNAG